MSEESEKVCIDKKDQQQDQEIQELKYNYDKKIQELEKRFEILEVKANERERSAEKLENVKENTAPKIDWGAQIRIIVSVASFLLVAGGGFTALYLGNALKPLENKDLDANNRITILERDVAVQKERVDAAGTNAVEAAEKLVEQQRKALEDVINRKEALRNKVERIEEEANEAVDRAQFEEKLATAALQTDQAIQTSQSILREDIDRIDVEGSETLAKVDALGAALAKTLDKDDFEQRFRFISERLDQDREFITQQLQQAKDFRESQREQDQAALLRIVRERITERMIASETRIEKLEEKMDSLLASPRMKGGH